MRCVRTSKEGDGSTFSFSVSLFKSNESYVGKIENIAKEEMSFAIQKLQGKHILLVEDNEMNQELAIDLLEKNGIEVTLAQNGQEALDKLEIDVFDIVLMDVQMPIMDGYTATKKIRAQEKFKNLPIIAMTANVTKEDIERAKEAGMNKHVGKPINPTHLFITMSMWA